MDYTQQQEGEFERRASELLRRTWASWQVERYSDLHETHEQLERAFPPALLISQSRVERIE